MRVTSSMYYKNIYANENSKLQTQLFDVNRQIASGLRIEYASDDVTIFTETMRLDNEITTLEQIKQSTDSGQKVADQSDVVMNEFNTSLTRFRTLLVQAANDTNDETSRDAIAKELRGIEENLKSIANTSINGKYLFAGSATDVKPIDDNGIYHGNDVALNAFVGSDNTQQYNITGAELFLGEEPSVRREVVSNVVHKSLVDDTQLTPDSKISDLMGDELTPNKAVFYLRGAKSDGTSINEKISLNDDDNIQDLMNWIGNQYGSDLVNVSLNDSGEIVVEDKIPGSSKLDFHLVGAIDFDTNDEGEADQATIDGLDSGTTTYPPSPNNLFIQEFSRSGLSTQSGIVNEGLVYDRTNFTKDGPILSSNVAQIEKDGNAFASSSTKLSEVFDLSQGNAGTLDGTDLRLVGTDISGNAYDITINLDSAGSTFKDNNTGDDYTIYNVADPREAADADDVRYQQLMDVMNMVVTGSLPAGGFADADEYDATIAKANLSGETTLSYDGKLTFNDLHNGITKAEISLYDANSGSFDDGKASVATFNTNNALTVDDPKTDFFKDIDEMIRAVENYHNEPDADIPGDPRNIGIQNALSRIDDLQNHIYKSHSTVGAQSNTLTKYSERTEVLKITTMSLRSSVIDTDLAEASLTLSQLNTNYEAMLSTVGKISKLSLVNYL